MNLDIRAADVIAVVLYLTGMLGLGAYFARRGGSAETYFVGRRDYAGWVVALSMLGTIISSTTSSPCPRRRTCSTGGSWP